MKILVLPKYSRKGASSRFRFFQYFASLEECGAQLVVEPLFDDDYLFRLYAKKSRFLCVVKSYIRRMWVLLKFSRQYDVVWLEKELFPWVPWFIEKWFVSLLKRPYVVDYDDAIFHQYDLHRMWIVRQFLSKKCDMVMKYSAQVVAGNNYLAARARQAGAEKVNVIPTVVSQKVYTPRENNNKVPIIGWVGSMSTARYLEKLRPVLRELKDVCDFHFYVVGARVSWDDVPVKNIDWTEEQEISLVQQFDIGIMPLIDSPWEKGKCGFKLIQYMACGKAVVADAVGVNSEIVENGENGFQISENFSWFQALKTLLEDQILRHAMGHSGYLRFKNKYSLECWSSQQVRVLRESYKDH